MLWGMGGVQVHLLLSLSHLLLLPTFLHSPTVSTFGPSLRSHPHQGAGAPQRSMPELQGIAFTELSHETHPLKREQAYGNGTGEPQGQFLMPSREITSYHLLLSFLQQGTSRGTAARGGAAPRVNAAELHTQAQAVCTSTFRLVWTTPSPCSAPHLVGQSTHLSHKGCHSLFQPSRGTLIGKDGSVAKANTHPLLKRDCCRASERRNLTMM